MLHPRVEPEGMACLVVEERAEFTAARGVFEFPQSLRLDLTDALASHRELLTDFFQCVVGVHPDTEAHAQHALFARRERRQHTRRGLAQVGLDRRIDRQNRVLVLDEIAEVRIFLIADRRFERERLLGDLENLAHFFERHAKLFRQFLRRRLAADLVEHLARGAHDLVDGLDHVHRDANGARLIGDARIYRPPSSGRYCLPGSDRGIAGRGWCISWRWKSRGADWPRPFPSWPGALRARPSAPSARSCGTRRSRGRFRWQACGCWCADP